MSALYRGALLLDGTGGRWTGHGLLVEGEHIARLAPIGEFEGYSGECVDLDGHTVLPGLIDSHVHLVYGAEPNPGDALERMNPGPITLRALEHAQRALHGGITTVRGLRRPAAWSVRVTILRCHTGS